MAFNPLLGPVFGPALRWSTNHALQSPMMDEIREDFRQQIWDLEDTMTEKVDEMLTMMRRLLEIMEALLKATEGVRSLTSTMLSSDVLTNEQLGQLIMAFAAAAQQQTPPSPPSVPTSDFGKTRGPRW